MLKLVLSERSKGYPVYKDRFIGQIYTSYLMNEIIPTQGDWLEDEFCLRVLKTFDGVTKVIKGVPVTFSGRPLEISSLSYGSKLLLMVYRNPSKIFRANFGISIATFIEELASHQDIAICIDSLIEFPFKYIGEIEIAEHRFNSFQTVAVAHNMETLSDTYRRYKWI